MIRKSAIALLLILVISLVATSAAQARCGTICWINRAADTYNVSGQMLLRKARCESGLNRFARGQAGEIGLFQFKPGTWHSTPYGGHSIYSVKWQSLAAAWAHAHGHANWWTCK